MSPTPGHAPCASCGQPVEPAERFCSRCGLLLPTGSDGGDGSDGGVAGHVVAALGTTSGPTLAVAPGPARGALPGPAPVAVSDPAPVAASGPGSGQLASEPPGPGVGGPLDVAPVRPDQVAGIGVRVGALLLDQLLVCLVVTVAAVVAALVVRGDGSSGPGLLLVPGALGLLVWVGQWVAEARTGATLGSRVLGIRTLSARTGRPAGLPAILLRQVVLAAGALVLLVGTYVVAASGTWDTSPSRRGWHDRAAGTMVLRAGSVSTASRRAAALGATRPPAPPAARSTMSGVPQPWPPSTGAVAPPPTPTPTALAAPPAPPPPPAPPSPSVSAVAVAPLRPSLPAWAVAAASAPSPSLTSPASTDPPPSGSAPTPPPPLVAPAPAPPAITSSPPPPPPPASAAPPVLGELELTRVVSRPPAPAADAPAPAVAPAPARLRLVFDTGEVVDVEGAGLVGRNPQPGPGVQVAHTVAIADPERSVSKVHLEFAPDGDGLVVVDRGSTNGTVVVDPQGRGRSLAPGVRARLEVGWLVLFGDRSFLIEQR